MENSLSKIDFVIGDLNTIKEMQHSKTHKPFDENVISFLDDVSKGILKNNLAKEYPDVITFGFWCRKASILSMKNNFNTDNRLGRGISFHIAPSNVAVNFAYSLVASLLSGNHSIVRLSSKEFPQIKFIIDAINESLLKFETIKIALVKYEHNKEITDYFSSISDSRVIWGGDNTINQIKKSPTKIKCIDIQFADKKSICIFNSDVYLAETNKNKLLNDFYNDTFLNDQNACSSPKLIAFKGESKGIELFWSDFNNYVKEKYEISESQVTSKYLAFCKFSAINTNVKLIKADNTIYRILVQNLDANILDICGNSGYFMEYYFSEFSELNNVLSSKCQTLSYYGFEKDEIRDFLIENKPMGVDRVVPIGKTLDFSLKWDGYDLISMMSREITF